MASDILIVDDEADIRELIAGILEDEGHETRMAANSTEALDAINQRRPSLVVLDIWLQGSDLDGLEVLAKISRSHPELPVVIISGHGNIETAVAAIKRGAYDYIEKPFQVDRLVLVIQRALEASILKRENRTLKQRSLHSDDIIGHSSIINQLRQSITKVAPTNSRVMIIGPSGAGKELAARVMHKESHRAAGPFVVLNAAAMAPDRMEHELFGVEEGRRSSGQVGALEEAHHGTLYIDEVADMPIETQGKILRVLVDQKFHRVGGNKQVKVDVRIISSTSRDIDFAIKAGTFRPDLFHRLNVVPLPVPGLDQRRDDIPELVKYFVDQVVTASGLAPRRIGSDVIAILQSADWPGNVRQLRNYIERLMILAEGDPGSEITADMLPEDLSDPVSIGTNGDGSEHLMSMPLREAREIFEKQYLTAQINRFGGNISRTAEFVGMERSALHRKLRTLGVNNNSNKAAVARHG